MSAGIDYSFGQANVDHESGIRYGIIHHGTVGQAWYDDSEAVYPEPECTCDCDNCQSGNCDCESDSDCEPLAFVYEKDGYVCEQGGDACEIFVMKSPYFTLCRFCSPCFPGAGDLDSPDPDGIRAYCFPHDWFEGGVAPYPVYLLKTGEEVLPLALDFGEEVK